MVIPLTNTSLYNYQEVYNKYISNHPIHVLDAFALLYVFLLFFNKEFKINLNLQ